MAFTDNPIINSPYDRPQWHFELDDEGQPTGKKLAGRRESTQVVPVPRARRRGPMQRELELFEKRVTSNTLVNEIRKHVEQWRDLPASQWGVTPETQRLLLHWRDPYRERKQFFCQREAIETLIWLTEVAPKRFRDDIAAANAEANPGLYRLACKMATGSGKTTVMAMIIAWHAVNKARRSSAKNFTDAFLIITPGITIRDRLRVLNPNDPSNSYEYFDLVPSDLIDAVRKARIVITNYHAFMLREKEQVSKLNRQILGGREGERRFTETIGEMIARVAPQLMGGKNVVVLNDEAHHCYRHKVGGEEDDPQLVWRGKDVEPDPLEVDAPPIYIQEKIQPQAIIEDLRRQTRERRKDGAPQFDFFHDFNGLPEGWKEDATASYYHDEGNWQNRMILGDALLVMASLAEREGLRGKVQCIYVDTPYGIKFNSNWQPSTKSRDVKDGRDESVSREPEVIRAFRDTWKDGIHSYVSYLRDRLIIARELLSERGSIFVQIGDENVHLARSLLDETFGSQNFVSLISISKTAGATAVHLPNIIDYVIWYAKSPEAVKFNSMYEVKRFGGEGAGKYNRVQLPDLMRRPISAEERRDAAKLPETSRIYRQDNLTSQSIGREKGEGAASWFPVQIDGRTVRPNERVRWKTNQDGMGRLLRAARVELTGNSLSYVRFLDDFTAIELNNLWDDVGGIQSRSDPKIYVVQTPTKAIERCILMTSDPGDLVLDPTCGSGTTAYVSEQWGRRWITIDTSRVALALARGRLMGARYDYYVLNDSEEGAREEAKITGKLPTEGPFTNNLRHGFVYERAPHVTLKSIASNAEIDVIWERWQKTLESLCQKLNKALKHPWEEWQVPREADMKWSEEAKHLHAQWWKARRARQKEIDESIARDADIEYLYDRPYKARGVVRVAGPFTVESLSPHRVLPMGEDPYLEELLAAGEEEGISLPSSFTRKGKKNAAEPAAMVTTDFAQVVYDNLKASGVQNTKKGERLVFEWLKPFASRSGLIQFEGRYLEKGEGKRAAVCIGPEYDTVGYELVRRAAREAADLFDTLVVCGFAFAPEVDETRLHFGVLTVLKARMNQDLRMADKLKATGAGNLFVVFGEPDIDIKKLPDDMLQVEIRGMDIFDPTTGEVRSSGGKELMNDVAAWFVDHDYDEESFFVRQAYFVGDDPYDGLKRALKAEIDETAWAELNSTVSRPFPRPKHGRICVKVINHFGDEVQKVFLV